MNRIKERREALGITQPILARRLGQAGIDLHVSMLSRFERGRCNPTPKQADAISDILQASLLELYDRADLEYHLDKPKQQEHRKAPFRGAGRLSESERKSLEHAMQIMGHDTMQDAIRAMVRAYIRTAKRREKRCTSAKSAEEPSTSRM